MINICSRFSTWKNKTVSSIKTSSEMRNGIILALRSEGMTLREIGRRINITNDSGHRVLIRFKHTLSMNHMTGSGRPRKTTIRDDAMIIGKWKKTDLSHPVELKTICLKFLYLRRLFDVKSLILESLKKAILKSMWTELQINRNVWSDESPFVLRYEVKRWVWRKNYERYSLNRRQAIWMRQCTWKF